MKHIDSKEFIEHVNKDYKYFMFEDKDDKDHKHLTIVLKHDNESCVLDDYCLSDISDNKVITVIYKIHEYRINGKWIVSILTEEEYQQYYKEHLASEISKISDDDNE
jgi:hypothetical protein